MNLEQDIAAFHAVGDESASEAWLRGRRRPKRDRSPAATTESSVAPSVDVGHSPRGPPIPTPSDTTVTTASDPELTERVATERCNAIVQWVIANQLGGRHNIPLATDTVAESTDADWDEKHRAFACQLAVEETRPTRAAIKKIVKYAVRVADGNYVVRSQDAPDEVAELRKHLMLCWDAVSAVGGLKSGSHCHSRQHALKMVQWALGKPGLGSSEAGSEHVPENDIDADELIRLLTD